MQQIKRAAAVFAASTVGAGVVLLGQFGSSVSAGAAPTSGDAAFVTANEQSNLAEIALGKLGGTRGGDAATRKLASVTLADHLTAKGRLTAAAKKDGASLPTAPNDAQMTVALALKSVSSGAFDLMYAQAEVTGHEQALAAARQELATTTNAGLKSYTTYYIGIATMHLRMAQAEVKALGGSPTGVPAGTGGEAATNQPSDNGRDIGFGAGAVLVLGGLGVAAARKRRITQ